MDSAELRRCQQDSQKERWRIPASPHIPSTVEGFALSQSNKPWFVYLVRCSDGTIYTGITKTVSERIATHNAGKGATYTAQRRPVSLLYQECHPDQGSALRREAEIKKWRKAKKETLVFADHL